jgi:hypothetical protein
LGPSRNMASFAGMILSNFSMIERILRALI